MRRFSFFFIIVSLILLINSSELKGEEPEPLLVIDKLGNGYSSPGIASDRIFVSGEKDGIGYLSAFDFSGKLIWKKEYGTEWTENFPGSRAAPVCIDTLVYVTSGMGDLACFDSRDGRSVWKTNMIRAFHGENSGFGYSLPVEINNEKLFCMPGGVDTNIVCLNRFNGSIIWISDGNGESSAYAPPLFFKHKERNLLVVFSELAMTGLDADTGEKLWIHDLSFTAVAPCNQPVYADGFLYVVQGSNNGAVKFSLSDDGRELKKIWVNADFCPYFGGFVMKGDFLFGSSERKRKWLSVNAGTGEITDTLSFGNGATTSWDEGLVIYNQNGKAGIVSLDNGMMKLITSFMVSHGSGEHFSHPVVAEGRIYIRHGDALLVYDHQQLRSHNRQ